MKKWQLQKAKAELSHLVLSVKEYKKLNKPKPHLVQFMRNSPLVGVKLKIERDKTLTREIDL